MAGAGVKLKPLSKGCKIKLPDEIKHGKQSREDHKHKKFGVLALPFYGERWSEFLWPVIYHDNCFCNMELAIRNRVIAACPIPSPDAIARLKTLARQLASLLPPVFPQEMDKFYQEYPKAKRDRYARGYQDLVDRGDQPFKAGITAFIKPDKINPEEKVKPDPRPIQFRDAPFAVEIAQYLKPIEPHLYQLSYNSPLCVSGTRIVAKGMDQTQRAQALIDKMLVFDDPVVVSLDMSRFDMHVNKSLLKVEHAFYDACFNCPRLRALLKFQLVNNGTARMNYSPGVKLTYKAIGRRMSGDMNTALGNCILMILMVIQFCNDLQVQFELLDDGDDLLLIISAKNVALVEKAALDYFLSFGMEVKVESIARTLEEVQFCQCSPIHTKTGWRFIRNPFKIMSTSLSGSRWAISGQGRVRNLKRMVLGQGICEGVLNCGVPVLAAYCRALIRNAGPHKSNPLFDERTGTFMQYRRITRDDMLAHKYDLDMEITDAARQSFHLAFGPTPDEQEAMERSLETWVINYGEPLIVPNIFDTVEWKFLDLEQWC